MQQLNIYTKTTKITEITKLELQCGSQRDG